ncbi:MAG TPA: RNA polymerase sigma factor [Acidimicrobiales bacterium]|nr:RNA polymerase sigma factor [Acidimicrobiales bacterium]
MRALALGGRAKAASLSDEALLAGMATGDEAATIEFVRRYQRRVFGLAYGILRDVDLAEDVAQEAMVRAWRHAAVYDPRRAPASAWVLTITRNLALDRRRARHDAPTATDELVALVAHAPAAEDHPPAVETLAGLRSALAGLPGDQRRALVLAAWLGLSAPEVAALEQIPLGTAKSRIRLALARLRALLDAQDDEP